MAAPLRRPISEEFSDRYAQPFAVPTPANDNPPATDRYQAANSALRPARTRVTGVEYSPTVPTPTPRRLAANSNILPVAGTNKERTLKGAIAATAANKATRTAYHASVKFSGGIALGWTALFNWIAFFSGVLALVGLGGVAALQSLPSYVQAAGSVVADLILGWDATTLWIIGAGFLAFHLVIVIGMFIAVYIQLTLSGAHTLSGRGSIIKKIAAALALILTTIPGINFIPWIHVWIGSVMLFPR